MTDSPSSIDRPRSTEAFIHAMELMPGGVNSPARAFGAVGGTPLFIERADGAYLFDVDGIRYVDYVGSWGPMILGHRPPAVIAALETALATGTSFGAPTEAESELAERIIDAVPSGRDGASCEQRDRGDDERAKACAGASRAATWW